jgi:hypothetical protein
VSTGRQLFVDTFLVESMPGLQLLNHRARWEQQVMRAEHPWEALNQVKSQSWPQGSRALGYAQPFSGGVWWDEKHQELGQPKPCYRAWYACGSNAGPRGGCCYMESDDGLTFRKPTSGVATGEGNSGAKGTNVVLDEYFDGNVVWLD